MKVLAVILNILLPGLGSLIVGKIGTGLIQLVLYGIGGLLTATWVLAIVGAPLCFIVWIWAIITAVNAPEKATEIIIRDTSGRVIGTGERRRL
jgi:TM2 domain-containing membrane protein YozV